MCARRLSLCVCLYVCVCVCVCVCMHVLIMYALDIGNVVYSNELVRAFDSVHEQHPTIQDAITNHTWQLHIGTLMRFIRIETCLPQT